MRLSLYLNPQTPGPKDDGRIISEVLGQVDLAQSLGVESVWLTDHQFTGYNAFSDPLVLAGAISQRNPGMYIGFSVVVAPLQHPIRFVTQCNLIDQLTKGRLIVGIGAGSSKDEYAGYGLTPLNRHDRMREFVSICEQAWSAPPDGFEFTGEHFTGKVNGRIIPEAVQAGGPHIAYATATPDTLQMVGRKGWSLLAGPQSATMIGGRLHYYANGLIEGGHSAEARERAWKFSGVLRQIYVADPQEDWQDTLGDYIETYVRKSAVVNSGIDDLDRDDFERRREGYLASWLYAGTPEDLIERLRPFAELGFGHVMGWFAFGHMPDALARRSIERFQKEVAPALEAIKPNMARMQQVIAGQDVILPIKRSQVEAREPLTP